MILFSPLRTKRLSVRLRELKGSEIIQLLSRPEEQIEGGTTDFLRIAAHCEASTPAHVTDPRLMTVQERMRLCTHYQSLVSEEGANFKVGKQELLDYLIADKDWDGKPIALTISDRPARMWPLLGWMAEALELVCRQPGEWQCGMAGCQIYFGADQPPKEGLNFGTKEAMEWAIKRRQTVLDLPESELLAVLDAWTIGEQQLTHFFNIAAQDDGVVALPTLDAIKHAKEAGAIDIAPARFPGSMCIGSVTRELFKRPAG